MQKLRTPLALSVALANACWALPALAQNDTTEETDRPVRTTQLEEVTVTATKRETGLMETPISITAFGQESLDRQGITNVKDMAKLVPNMEISMDSSQTAPVISMRGVRSTNITELGDPSVGLHLDGIYSPRPQGAMALMFDVERVEAMRGPQGTLFGRNSTVGSVNIISRRPDFEAFDASIGVEAGRWNHQQTRGMINIPVSDTFALRAAFMQETRDSYLDGYYDPNQWDTRYLPQEVVDAPAYSGADSDRTLTQRDRWGGGTVQELVKADPEDFYNNSDQYAFRIAGLWEPGDRLSWMLSYEQFRDNSAGSTDTLNCDLADKRVLKDGDGNYLDAIGGNVTDEPVPGLLGCESVYGPGADEFTVNVSVPGMVDLSIDTVRSNLDWDLSDSLKLVYNAGWAEQVRSQRSDQDRGITGWDMSIFFDDATFESQSHELQLQSTGDGPLQWITGLFYFQEDNAMAGGWINSANNADFWDQPNRTLKSEAVFAQATYDLTDRLALTAGLRYTKDTKQDRGGRNLACNADTINPQTGEACFPAWDRDAFNQLPPGYFLNSAMYEPATNNEIKGSWDFTNYRLGLDYQASDDLMVFGYVANGFKSGGIGDVVVQYEQDPITTEYPVDDNGDRIVKKRFENTYEPEIVTTYELGAKGTFLDGSLNLTGTLFYSDYEDMQAASAKVLFPVYVQERDNAGELTGEVTTEGASVFQTENIGSAAIKGLEVEFDWAPYPNGRVNGYFTWLDTEITSDFMYQWAHATTDLFEIDSGAATDPSNETLTTNFKGNELAVSPPFAVSLNYSHTFEFNDGSILEPAINVYWRDQSYYTFQNVDKHLDKFATETPDAFTDERPEHHNVNLTLKYGAPGDQWNVEAFVNNATDQTEFYWAGGGDGVIKGPVSMPRFYGVRGNYNF